MYGLARALLFRLDAERAHALALKGLDATWRSGLNPLLARRPAPLPTQAFGLDFENPVGLAAGLDKNGDCIDALAALGFGFIEIGTTTPKPQAGNPKPRMFRLPEHTALINRLGFNNEGVDALVRKVEASRLKRTGGATRLGINIGKNRDTPNEQAASDYLHCLGRVYPLADYVAVNISSPNTAGLRELQEEKALRALVASLLDARESLATRHRRRVPLLVKIAPDLSEDDIDASARVLGELGVDGVICGNTTTDRLAIEGHPLAGEAGGLSGHPLYGRSTTVLRRLRSRLPAHIPLVGVGGILSGADAAGKATAGAELVQFYTGLIYRGPALVGECVEALRHRREGPH
ncbi:MAG: quinone-dependent dihydroorotate dehydrogenase [Xanthomonadaceae bacterium]|jgi:dihydroorotate dehydrogenase|nr:quinone-dependent dihydroorotate dehydrogenase [Xanthomonadaceae bacterium]